jgi:hypothetical protein
LKEKKKKIALLAMLSSSPISYEDNILCDGESLKGQRLTRSERVRRRRKRRVL